MKIKIIENKIDFNPGLIGEVIDILKDEYKAIFKINQNRSETCFIPKNCVIIIEE